jgi:Predicted AAA-ATPase/PD-(D/E)XK nuclease superfamily
MNLPKLPIGIQHFDELREGNYLYIDKTEFVYKLLNDGGAFFLARPRRFGKSLFLSTVLELAKGRRDLFTNTWIADKWDWQRKYPIVHLPFAKIDFKELGLRTAVLIELHNICKQYDIIPETESIKQLLGQILTEVSAKHGKIVLLIDEYDKPIIEYLEKSEMAQSIENQKIMKNFYGILKDSGQCLHLTFITGVSKFARVSLFSDLNHLEDLTLDHQYATAFGYTQTEVEAYFEPHIAANLQKFPDLTREMFLQRVKNWYNGYSWDNKTSVYNPFGLLNFFKKGQFMNYWFQSGTPTFLMHLLLGKGETSFENYTVSPTFLDQYDLENIQSASLLFQTGYLTIKNYDENEQIMTLDYPNFEVRDSFYQFLMTYMGQREVDSKITVRDLAKYFRANDLENVYYSIEMVLNGLPYDVYKASNEALFHGLIHILFQYMGLNIESEVHTKRGRLDAMVQTDTHIYIFEFKYNKTTEAAMAQLLKRDYASKYRHLNKKIIGIAINFNKENRAIDEWIVQDL